MRMMLAILLCTALLGCSLPPAEKAVVPRTPPDPARAKALYKKGLAVQRSGDKPAGIALFYQAIQADPGHAPVRNHLAWLRGCDPDPKLRDGAEAVRLAEAASRLAAPGAPSIFTANVLDTLAAAYARTGRFADAMKSAGRAAAMMDELGNRRAARSFRDRQEKYRQSEPHQDP